MNLLDLLSSTVVESMHTNKEYKEDPSLAPSSLVPEKRSQRNSKKKNQVEEVLDSKTVEGHRWYLVKYRGLSDSENSWQPYENLDCEALIEEYEDKPSIKGIPAEVDATKRNLDAVKEALKVLGGKAFGGAIVEWICANRNDMLHAFGGDKKKLRYCVNGLLSARVNASIFEKKVYKENGTTKTEWMLADINEPIESHISSDSSPQKQKEEKLDPSNPAKSPETSEEESNGIEEPKSPMIEDETSKGSISPEENGHTNGLRKLSTRRTRTSVESGSSSPRANLLQQVIKEERNLHLGRSSRNSRGAIKKEGTPTIEEKEDFYDENLPNQTELDDQMEEEDNESYQTEGAVGGVPQTYRGMIKVALEYMGGQATFESISKFIGTRFKDQLINKAETWKHSIAGCLSVYFARKEQKDPSGKVIWTLGEPPKPKRRGRKRDRDDVTRSPDREVTKGKRKKEDMVMIPVEQLEALEEENECLKLVVVKKKKDVKTLLENSNANFNTEPCEACHERKELYMILNPCGHLFCGSIFCEASTAKQCMICNAVVTTRLPARKGKGSTFVQKRNNALANKEFSKTGNLSNQNHANLVD